MELIGQINLYTINLLCGFKVVLSPCEQAPLFSPGKEKTKGRYKGCHEIQEGDHVPKDKQR